MERGKIITGIALAFLLTANAIHAQSNLQLNPTYSFKVEYSDASKNFLPERDLSFAGDLNKDGSSDFFFTVVTADEETPELEDLITKMSIYYGSSSGLDISDNIVVRDNFSFITDIDGDSLPESIKFVDGALYLVKDESLGDFSQLIETEILDLQNITVTDIFVESYGDINGDGFNDVIVYDQGPNQSGTVDFYVIYGANDFNNVLVDTLSYQGLGFNGGIDRFMYDDIDSDGEVEFVRVSNSFQASSPGFITVSQIDSDTLKQVDQVQLSASIFTGFFPTLRNGTTGLADLNGDGNQELVLEVDGVVTIFLLSSNPGEFYSEANIYATTYKGEDFSILGNYNDGVGDDLLIQADTLLFLTSDMSLNLMSTPLIVDEGEKLSLISNKMKNINSGGDVNGDGIDDITVEFENTNSYGYRVYFGNSSGDFSNSDEITFSIEDNLHRTPHYTFNTGDLNNDGVEDFGIVYNQGGEARVFYGGVLQNNQTPDLIFGESSNAFMLSPSIGDFNGDNVPDILITERFSSSEANDSKFNIYYGGVGMDTIPDYTMLFSTVFPEFEFGEISNARNIGDINMDGYDDIMFISSYDQENSYILYGGTTISASPDLTLPFFANNIEEAGDFNNDGRNDFLISILNNPSNINDEVRLFSGFDEGSGESFNTEPILTFSVPKTNPTSGENYVFFGQTLATGDLDGDDITDIAIGSFSHQNNTGGGIDAIQLYKGGTSADSIADGSIALTKQVFGESRFSSPSINDTLKFNVGSLTIVPDQNGDGTDELLFSTGAPQGYLTNAAIFYGGDLDTLGSNTGVLFKAPNQSIGLGVDANSFIRARGTVAVGDFDGDDINDFIFAQGSDPNFLTGPVYIYSSNEFTVSIKNYNDSPSLFKLDQNYPNPFNPTTTISYTIPNNSRVKLVVYDVLGRVVSTLVDKQQVSGTYEINLNAAAWASGVYFYRIETGSFIETKQFTLIK